MIELPKLQYPMDGLAPHISEETLEYHYGKHHAAYVSKLNAAIEGTPDAGKSLEEIVRSASGGLFNNAAQAWNHSFYWSCLSPDGGREPSGALAEAIVRDFGSVAEFRQQFSDRALTTFGSGWAWLVKRTDGGLSIESTGNADTPITGDATPVLVCDVWEHAYYIDYRNDRAKYIAAFWKLVDWGFAASQFG